MPNKTIATYKIDYLQVMDETGHVDSQLMPEIDDDTKVHMYKMMVLSRMLDDKLVSLQRQGRISTVAQAKGQEAAQIGAMAAITKDDWMVPSFRESAAYLYRGLPIKNFFMYAGGDERGSVVEGPQHDLPVSIPVGSHPLHAVGISWAMKLKNEKNIALAFFGDGATSEGEVHEAFNFSGVYKTPTIFLCQNNQFAISLPREKQTAALTIAQKAIAYGIGGMQVDGNDVFAVYAAVKAAAERARKGEGATLIEAVTYRLGHHTTSDDATRYRSEEMHKQWEKKDPIVRLKAHLEHVGLWNDEKENAHRSDCENQINNALSEYEQMDPPKSEDMFTFTYEQMTAPLQEQLEYLKQFKK